MDPKILIDGLLLYIGLVVLLTFHEFGHAWMAWKCGDDTARLLGRVSLNPLVHIDLIGTVVMPLLMIFLSMSGSGLSGFLVGWAKPVPVNPAISRTQPADVIVVPRAGPGMSLLLAIVLRGLAGWGVIATSSSVVDMYMKRAHLPLLFFFSTLFPTPPLDGSRVVR